jgi:two-component system, NarL family, response regulator NreC
MSEIQVLLVDDHVQLRAELRRLINNQPDLRLVAEAGGAQEAVRLALQGAFTVVVMDLSLPDGDGITATAEILQQRPELRVLGLSRHEDVGYLKRMLAAGARGYVLKRNIVDGLLTAIRTVAAGGRYIDPYFVRKQPEQPAEYGGGRAREAVRAPAATDSDLSADEIAVLKQVAWGHSNREITEQLGMAEATVAQHKVCAMQKLGLRTRIDVIHYAEAQGWRHDEMAS